MKYIMLHGLGQSSESWSDTVKVFNDDFEVLCPNLSDWLSGKTPCYDTLYRTLETYSEQFEEPLNICGLSLGGILAMQYAIEHPEKMNSLVLIGTQYEMPKYLLKMQNLIFRIMPCSAFEKMGFQKTDFINLCKSMTELNFKHELKKISCSVLVVCGDKDKINKKASLELQQQIENAEIAIIENAGHEVNTDTPTLLGQKLNVFFKQYV